MYLVLLLLNGKYLHFYFMLHNYVLCLKYTVAVIIIWSMQCLLYLASTDS